MGLILFFPLLKTSMILVLHDLAQQSLDDAKSSKLCGMELSDPEFTGLATQDLKTMINYALEKGK